MMRTLLIFLIFTGSLITTLSFAQSLETSSDNDRIVPYVENSSLEYTFEGNIDYDAIMSKIMPGIYIQKFSDLGISIESEDVVLNRGPRILGYLNHSYNCGYVIDKNTDKVYWLEAAINSTHIQYAKIFDDLPPKVNFAYMYDDCFYPLTINVSEYFLKDKSYLTDIEEARAVASLKHDLRGNENLNKFQFKVGKFNLEYVNENTLWFCGSFNGKVPGSKFFVGALNEAGQLEWGLENNLSHICVISENATLYDSKFQEKQFPDDSLQTWKNIRNELVHTKQPSAEKLLERNYIRTESVPNLNLEYSTSFDIDFIDYRPEKSGTVFYFKSLDQDTFAKIRVPQNGVNYYMNYGPNEWNAGDILNVIISVGEDDPEFIQRTFVRSPEAPYPQYFTDYIFKVPKGSTMMAIVLEIENYKIDEDKDLDEWEGVDLRH